MTAATDTWGRVGGHPAKRWQLARQAGKFTLTLPDGVHTFVGDHVDQLRVGRAWLRHVLWVKVPGGTRRLTGLSKRDASAISAALDLHRARFAIDGLITRVVPWAQRVQDTTAAALTQGRWFPTETAAQLLAQRPTVDNWEELAAALELVWASLADQERTAVTLFRSDFYDRIATVNESVVQSELTARKAFFDRIETSPLTQEQARAVVCFENRVNLIAAAGSGKTSVMVARAAYAVYRGFVAPARILLLAFNKDAAVELRERLVRRLGAVGLPAYGVTATTFHAFGLGLIGQATGRKPRLAPWLEFGEDIERISRFIDELRDSSMEFRLAYDTFRLLYARTGDDPTRAEPDAWDPVHGRQGHRTFSGNIVRSQSEKIIADFLYLSGVRFEYERVFPFATPDARRGEYRPDFYYPDVDTWHEHWALDAAGHPPKDFTGYAADMARKRGIHHRLGTTLIETTWASIMGTDGVAHLAGKMTAAGLRLDWDPDRPISDRWAQPPTHEDMAKLIRTFMTHVKSNSSTRQDIDAKLAANPRMNTPRTRHFLALYWPIHNAWQAALAKDNVVDFEDMLVQAAELLDAGATNRDYDLVLVDEFQDASQARARLTRALVEEPGKYLLTVGDDWQAINRFAGADISVMTDFRRWFGEGPTLYLSTTFRCTQEICDVSSALISKNPRQLPKTVTAAHGERGPRIRLQYAASGDEHDLTAAIQTTLERIADEVAMPGPGHRAKPGRPVSVYVLGRYNFDRRLLPNRPPAGLSVTFKTMHSSKGLEADYVIIPNLSRGNFGFPSEIVDDPVLNLAMAEPDEFEHAEERRLFYVALTRARIQVTLIAAHGKESIFVTELIKEEHVDVIRTDPATGEPITTQVHVCPTCGEGVLVQRHGKYGHFYGCSRFPKCRHSQNTLSPT